MEQKKLETEKIINELTMALTQIRQSELVEVIKEIRTNKSIFVYGKGRSGLMLKAFAMRLMQLGYNVYVLGETITPSIKANDLLLVASASGETQSVVAAAKEAIAVGAQVAAILADVDSSLGKLQPLTIVEIDAPTKFTQKENSIQPLGTLFEQTLLLMGDLLILCLSEGNSETYKKMAKRHANAE